MRKRLTAVILCLCLLFTLLPATAFAEGETGSGAPQAGSALCEHHPQHDESCGYTEGTEEIPCSHEHDEDCYKPVTECVHERTAECCPAESVSENTAAPSEAEKAEPTACTHICSEESGCITEVLDCEHEHDEACGYVPATEGTPCTFVCEICDVQDSGTTATPSDAQPEECICETLCTEDNINADCPVCGAEGADLTACKGEETLPVSQMKAASANGITPRMAYDTLWIGNTRITGSGYWTTDGNGNLTASDAGNYNVAFDADTNTLTLNNATIAGQYDPTYNGSDAGIYAYSRSGSVSLTIQVTGNNMVSGNVGIYVLSNGGEVSVRISGGGSLTASGRQNGLRAFSNVSNAALTIEGTAVEASGGNYTGDAGVLVQAGKSSSGSLAVNGGSLTASGNPGISFWFGTGDNGSGTPSLTVSGNAAVDAKNGGITHNSGSNLSIQGDSGIVFNESSGTVYGNASLQKALIIGAGESLTIGDGASLNANGHNVIVDGGTVDEGIKNSLGENVIYKVTKVELDKSTLTLDAGDEETLTVTITPDNATDKTVKWKSDNTNIAEVDANGKVIAVSAGSTTITATAQDGSGEKATCTVTVAADPAAGNRADVDAAKTAVEDHTWTVPQSTANTGEAVRTWIEGQLAGLEEIRQNDVDYTVTLTGFTAAAEGTAADQDDTDGSFAFTVTLSKGEDTGETATSTYAEAVVTITDGRITAATCDLWTVTVTAGNGGIVSGGGTFADGSTVTVTAVPNSGYHFVRWTENGAQISGRAEYSFTLTAEFAPNAGGSSTDGGHIENDEADEEDSGSSSAGISVQEKEDGPFADVSKADWFYNDVMFAWLNGLMDGAGAVTFSPDAPVTRAQVALIFFRLAGSPDAGHAAAGRPPLGQGLVVKGLQDIRQQGYAALLGQQAVKAQQQTVAVQLGQPGQHPLLFPGLHGRRAEGLPQRSVPHQCMGGGGQGLLIGRDLVEGLCVAAGQLVHACSPTSDRNVSTRALSSALSMDRWATLAAASRAREATSLRAPRSMVSRSVRI